MHERALVEAMTDDGDDMAFDEYGRLVRLNALRTEIARFEKVIEEAHDLLEQYAPAAKFRTWEISSR